MRTHSRCGASAPDEEFAWSNKAKGERRNRCKPCHAAVTREWRIANPEKWKIQKARNRKRHPERGRRNDLRQRQANLEKYRARERAYNASEHGRATRRAWYKTPLGVETNRRNALTHMYGREAVAWWTSLVDPVCSYCDDPATTIDHVIPVSKGGTHDLSNLVPACRPCNASKGDKDVDSWRENKGMRVSLSLQVA